jgi:hypothetical protein
MPSTYTYSLSTDFPNGLDTSQLSQEIIANSNITPVLLNVQVEDDVVNIIFQSSLSSGEITELNTIVANHVPAPIDNIEEYTGRIQFTSSLADSQAISLIASDSDGGIYLNAQNGGIVIDANGAVAITSADVASIDGFGVNIGNGDYTTPINIGSSSAAKVINIGNVTGATSVAINSGSSGIAVTTSGGYSLAAGSNGISIGNDGTSHPITIGNSTGSSSVAIKSGAGNIDIGIENVAKSINIGNTVAGTSVSISSNNTGGGGNITIASSGSSSTTTLTSAGTVTIGDGSVTAININPGSGNLSVGGTGNINVATSGAGRHVSIGNTGSASKLSLRWGESGGFFTTHQETPTSLANGNATLTMDNNSSTGILNRILVGSPSLARNLTMPTAASAVSAISGVQVNDAIDFTIIASGGVSSYTLVTNTGVTLTGSMTVSSGISGTFRIHFTNVSSGTETYAVYRIN